MIREVSDPTVDVVHEDVELDGKRATEALAPADLCNITLSCSEGGKKNAVSWLATPGCSPTG